MQRLPALKRGASSNLQPRAFFCNFFGENTVEKTCDLSRTLVRFAEITCDL